jgi:hypothetical protein
MIMAKAKRATMTTIEYLDQPPSGWFVLDVMRREERSREWTALMADVHPDDLKNCTCDFPALFFVDPKDYRPGDRKVNQGWFHIPGKHRGRDAAWDALEQAMATQH